VIGTADTEVDIQLERREEGTEITLVHSGLPKRQGAEAYVGAWWWLDNLPTTLPAVPLRLRATTNNARTERQLRSRHRHEGLPRAGRTDQLDRWIAGARSIRLSATNAASARTGTGGSRSVEMKSSNTHGGSGLCNVVRWQLDNSVGYPIARHSGFDRSRHKRLPASWVPLDIASDAPAARLAQDQQLS
jgi:hypothetical protein